MMLFFAIIICKTLRTVQKAVKGWMTRTQLYPDVGWPVTVTCGIGVRRLAPVRQRRDVPPVRSAVTSLKLVAAAAIREKTSLWSTLGRHRRSQHRHCQESNCGFRIDRDERRMT